MNPIYPVYIISKGRWESRLTSNALELMKVPYKIVIEPQEYDAYAAIIDPAKILVLPFSNLGLGGIPARNWVWEHSTEKGHARHWILDDNIPVFYRLNNNIKVKCETGGIFRAAEDFVDRYTNIKMSGFNYAMFAKESQLLPPFVMNTKVYSCILLSNDTDFRWRGKYNEDVDLSIRFLKAGYPTIQFNAFLAGKVGTQSMKGGNTDELYKHGTYEKSISLVNQHPDVVTLVHKFGRDHHQVDYSPFKKLKLIRKPNIVIPKGINNFGMKLIEIKNESQASMCSQTTNNLEETMGAKDF